jgi:hypothetical protein
MDLNLDELVQNSLHGRDEGRILRIGIPNAELAI